MELGGVMFLDKFARPVLDRDQSISIEPPTQRGNDDVTRNFNSHSVEN